MSLQLNAQRKNATKITMEYNKKLLEKLNSEYHRIELEDVEYIKEHLILLLNNPLSVAGIVLDNISS